MGWKEKEVFNNATPTEVISATTIRIISVVKRITRDKIKGVETVGDLES